DTNTKNLPRPEFFDSKGDVHKNADRQVDKVEYPDGERATLKYDKNHDLVEIKNKDGSRLAKDKDGEGWTSYDAHGKKVDHLAGTVEVNDKGEITAKRKDGFTEIERPDGSSTTTYPDKTVVEAEKGRVTSITHPDQPDQPKTEIKYDSQGKPIEIAGVNGGQTWKKEGNEWNVYDSDGHMTHSGMKEVQVTPSGDIVTKGEA